MDVKDFLQLSLSVALVLFGGFLIILYHTGQIKIGDKVFLKLRRGHYQSAFLGGVIFVALGFLWGIVQLAFLLLIRVPVTGITTEPTELKSKQVTESIIYTQTAPTFQPTTTVMSTISQAILATAPSTVVPALTFTPMFTPTFIQNPTVTSTLPLSKSQNSESVENLIKQDSGSWERYLDHNARADVTENNSGYCLSMANPGSDGYWDVVFHQKDIKLKKGVTYRFSFIAYADPAKVIDYRIMSFPDYQKQFAGSKIDLNTDGQVFLDDFTQGGDGDYSVDLEFRVGGTAPGKVCISDVLLEDLAIASHPSTWVWGDPPTCKNNSVGMQNKSDAPVDSEQEMWDKDGNSVGASKSSVTPGNWGSVGWSGNPPVTYIGPVKWLIVFTDPTTGKVLASYPGSTTFDCTKP